MRVEDGSAASLAEQSDQEAPPQPESWYEADEGAGELPWTGAAEAQTWVWEQPEAESPFLTPAPLEAQDTEAADVAAWLEDEDGQAHAEDEEAEARPAGTSAGAGRAGQGPGAGQVTVGVAELVQLWDTAAGLDHRIRRLVRQALLERGGLTEPAMAPAAGAWEMDRALETEAGQQWEDKPAYDTVDGLLDSRTSLFKVAIVGTNVQVNWPKGQNWTAQYTRRVLSEAAMLAALRALYDPKLPAASVRAAWQKLVGHGTKYTEVKDPALLVTLIEDEEMTKFAAACGFEPQRMVEVWRKRRGQAKLIEFALGSAYKSFADLAPHLPAKELAAKRMTADVVRHLLDRRSQAMVEVAKRHPAAKWWRDAFESNPALKSAQREPMVGDLPRVTWDRWARTILALAVATRDVLRRQFERDRADAKKHALNEHLRPHEVKVDDAAAYILKTFDPTPLPLDQYGWKWIVQGGQILSNAKNQRILLLRVDGRGVVYQNLVDTKFYEQSLDGFVQELVYGIYTAAGQKSLGAIALTKWAISVAGTVFPQVRYGLMATDVLNAGFKLKANQAELEASYESVKIAYANIDKLLPGVLPKVWDAVLDKRNVALFNPLENPDFGAWLKGIIRFVMLRQARAVKASYVGDAVDGFLRKGWGAIKKGLGVVSDVVKSFGSAVVGSTGVSGDRALKLAEQRLKELGVVGAAAIALQIGSLSAADKQQLVRELEDLIRNGMKLMEIIKKSLSW